MMLTVLLTTGSSLPPWAVGIGEASATYVGPWINDELAFGIRWLALVAALAVLVAIALADTALRWLVRRKIRRDAATAEEAIGGERELRYWLGQGLRAAVPPIELLLWIHGASAALSVLLAGLTFREQAHVLLAAVGVLRSIGTLVGLFWLLYQLSRVVEAWLGHLSVRTGSLWDQVLIPLAGKTVRLTLPLVALILGMPTLAVSAETQEIFKNVVSLVLIGTVALVLLQLVNAAATLVLRQHRLDVADNLRARRIYTQVTVLKKIAMVVVGVFTLASMLMVFDSVRQFGTSILASAGIAGIIVGFAAQRSIATLLAGFQIAFTQPIRLDDIVIVENEFARVEDITLTYVVVRTWDLRRLVLPITYFIEQPFQNWTRTSSDILGSVFFHVDYAMPVVALREELDRILAASKYWDGRVKVLQVTDAGERTLQLRALASARDAASAWDLRCEIREKLITFVQQQYPQHLPRTRAELQPAAAEAPAPKR
jgi:small-conductance mechanosensitive channel